MPDLKRPRSTTSPPSTGLSPHPATGGSQAKPGLCRVSILSSGYGTGRLFAGGGDAGAGDRVRRRITHRLQDVLAPPPHSRKAGALRVRDHRRGRAQHPLSHPVLYGGHAVRGVRRRDHLPLRLGLALHRPGMVRDRRHGHLHILRDRDPHLCVEAGRPGLERSRPPPLPAALTERVG